MATAIWKEDMPAYIVRGDLLSVTGYARAARALASLILEKCPVFGISIHVDPNDKSQPFPGRLIDESEVSKISEDHGGAVVVHHTTPDNFKTIPDATNIGAFYWETNGLPRAQLWADRIATMDAIWAPTKFIENFARRNGFNGPIHLMPWPQSFAPSRRAKGKMRRNIWFLDSLGDVDDVRKRQLADVRNDHAFVFVSVQSLAPRKGLPLLLVEWRDFVAATPDIDCALVLKLSFRHAHGIGADPLNHFLHLLRRYGIKPGDRLRVAVIADSLTDDELSDVVAQSDALISMSYGEGFGGPIVEAIAAKKPVITPSHTGIADLIPENYVLTVGSTQCCVSLRDNMDIYPHSSTWHLPDEGELGARLSEFVAMTASERAAICDNNFEHARTFCSTESVRERLHRLIDGGKHYQC